MSFTPPLRQLYSIEAAAVMSGVSVKRLVSAINNGDVPNVSILHLGPRRLRYVRSHQFLAWVEGRESPPAPGVEADRAAEAAVAENFHPTNYDDNLFQ